MENRTASSTGHIIRAAGSNLALTPEQAKDAALQRIQPIVEGWVLAHYRDLDNQAMAARVIYSFFTWLALTTQHTITAARPQLVSSAHVVDWQRHMENANLSPATIYTRLSRLSAFYQWLMNDRDMGKIVTSNPVSSVRPPAPKAYANSRSKALDDTQLRSIIDSMRAAAGDPTNIAAKRDYAIFLWLLYTGMRREEILRLTWGDLTWHDAETISFRTTIKGGEVLTQQLAEPTALTALWDYLDGSNRRTTIQPSSPLWISSTKAKTHATPLTARAFDYAMKNVAKACGIEHFHIHQTRHTFARLVMEMTDGDVYQVQRELNHKNVATTRIYVQAVAVKKDRFSSKIAAHITRKEKE